MSGIFSKTLLEGKKKTDKASMLKSTKLLILDNEYMAFITLFYFVYV